MAASIGPDYADIDGDEAPDFVKIKNAGIRFVVLQGAYGRPTNGQTPIYKDQIWKRDAGRARSAGLKITAYLFLCMPQKNRITPDPEVQVDAFADHCPLVRDLDWAPFFDVEEESTLSPQEYFMWVARAFNQLVKRFGCIPNMYTSARVWAEYLNHHSPGVLLDCALWLAKPWPLPLHAPVHLDGMPNYSPTLIPEYGNQWFLYQYQGDARNWPGNLFQADASRFRVFGKGAKGNHVVWLQRRLRASVAPSLIVDGDFGAATGSALGKLQAMHGLAPDEILGVDSFALLCWIIP